MWVKKMDITICISEFKSYNEMKKILRVSYYTAKELVAEYFGNDEHKISEYESKFKTRRKIKPKSSKDKILSKFDTKFHDYINQALISIPNSKKISTSILINFFKSQIEYYSEKDDFISNFKQWVSEEKTWNSMDKKHWVYRYGIIEGEKRYNKRMSQCDMRNLDNNRLLEIKKTISDGVQKHLSSLSEYDIKAQTPVCIEYYLKRGYSEEESIKLQKEQILLRKQNKNFGFSTELNANIPKTSRTTNIEYYLHKGLTQDEAEAALYDRQNNFTLEKCIARHGEEDGTRIYNNRQDRWQATLNAKSDEEKERINKAKGITLENQILKYGKELGTEKYLNWLSVQNQRFDQKGYAAASKESRKIFDIIISEIEQSYKDIEYYIGYPEAGNEEYFIIDEKTSKIFFYDFTIPELKIIIEFHGKSYHYNEEIGCIETNWRNLDNELIKHKDLLKKELAENNEFEYIVIWEGSDYASEAERAMERIRSSYLRNKNTNC